MNMSGHKTKPCGPPISMIRYYWRYGFHFQHIVFYLLNNISICHFRTYGLTARYHNIQDMIS